MDLTRRCLLLFLGAHPPGGRITKLNLLCNPPSSYLEATSFSVDTTITRLIDTLVWRESFGVDSLGDDPSVESEVGVVVWAVEHVLID